MTDRLTRQHGEQLGELFSSWQHGEELADLFSSLHLAWVHKNTLTEGQTD